MAEYNGKEIKPLDDEKVYIILNKPRGIVCTASDEKGRTNVTDICREAKNSRGEKVRLYPVGRLDMDSDGLLLLTNDGELANKLTHPKHTIPKIYHVTLRGIFEPDSLSVLGEPIELDGKLTMRVKVKFIAHENEQTIVSFELYEGKNRQIRRMCEAHGVKISRLQRTAIGKLTLGKLEIGKWRYLTASEIEYLKKV